MPPTLLVGPLPGRAAADTSLQATHRATVGAAPPRVPCLGPRGGR